MATKRKRHDELPVDVHGEELWHPDLKGIVKHTYTLGDPMPPAPVESGLAFLASSSSMALPRSIPVSGSLVLCNAPGSHLDYDIVLQVGELLEGDLVEEAPPPHFCRFVVVMDIWETFVPVSHRGRDLGTALVKAAFALAANRGWGVKPSCSYVRDTYIRRQCHSPIALYQHGPSGPRTELKVSTLVLFSEISHGKHSFKDRRRVVSKKSTKQLAAAVKKLSPQQRRVFFGPSEAVHASPLVTVERLLRVEFCELSAGPKHFYRWADPSSRSGQRTRLPEAELCR